MGIGNAFSTLRRSFRHGYDNLLTLAFVGMIWYLSALLIVPIGPITAGLHRVTQRWSEERATTYDEVYRHFRSDFGWSTRLALVLLVVLIALVANLQFYLTSDVIWLHYVGITILAFTLAWLGIMLVSFAFALRQERPGLRMSLGNSAVLVFGNFPGIAVSLLLLGITTAVFLFVPPLFLLIPGWIALWGEEHSRLLLVQAGYLQPDPYADRERRKG